MSIILWSCLVSLVTLGVLLFNRSHPRETKIPSAFLGGSRLEAPRKLALTKPPWLLWLMVLLATVGAAVAYWPPNREGRADVDAHKAIVWVDESLSAVVSRREQDFSAADAAADITALGMTTYGLREGASGDYELEDLSGNGDVRRFLEGRFARPPSAFSRPLAVESVSAILARDSRFANGKSMLVVISDGQRATLRNLAPLKATFSGVRLIASREPTTLLGDRQEIVPAELLSAWGLTAPEAPRVFAVLDRRDERIPQHARPQIVRESFRGKEQELAIVARDDGRSALFPLVIACTPAVAGPLELDAMADLRAFAQFFAVPFRFENCSEETEAGQRLEREPWRFRQRALWVVPVGRGVAATLVSGRVWYPKGFVREGDGLVYAAPSSGGGWNEFVRPLSVGLDPGVAPLVLPLLPVPPEGGALVFDPTFVAADKTPLGFRLRGKSIHYLRTTLAMPNGELGRSARWADFWLEVARSLPQGGGMLRTVSAVDREDLRKKLAATGLEDLSAFSLALDPAELTLGPVEGVPAGLFVSPATFEQVLLVIADEERALDVVSVAEFEESWVDGSAGLAERERVQRERRFFPVAGAILCSLALVGLWLLKGPLGLATTLLFALVFSQQEARAQNLRPLFAPRFVPVSSVPFRISWCNLDMPPRVAGRYRELRELLAERGTIRLPKEILPGACKAGASEIWWTDDVGRLAPEELRAHVAGGGFFIWEGAPEAPLPEILDVLASPPVGLEWESPAKRGMLYRSFYLLHTFDGCSDDKTLILRLRKKVNAQAPMGIVTAARFLTPGSDCFGVNEDFRTRSFVNLMYAVLTTDYKEDHMHLPELLNRVRNLGLEP